MTRPSTHSLLNHPRLRSRALVAWGLSLFALGVLPGCVSPWERSALLKDKHADIGNVQGPTERRLRDVLWRKEKEEALVNADGSLKPIPGTEEYLAAEALFEKEEYEAAQASFKKIAKKFKKSEIREDALFMKGEAAYQQGRFYDAENAYAELLRDYPSTRHLDEVSRRLFNVAQQWLDFPKAADLGEVQQVNYEDFRQKAPAEKPVEKSRTPVWVPNFTDQTKPWFDTEGNGVACLKLIWLNDPTGPLADDALMLAASHYARRGDFIEADRHFTLLREEYPNSPHVQNAFVLGSHVKLMSYQGPEYDHKTLEDAESLKQSILRLYPDSEDAERVKRELAKIEEAKAAREWELVVFYERKGNKRAQSVYCHLLLDRFPETSFAKLARERLVQLGPEYANGTRLLTSQPDPERAWWDVRGGLSSEAASVAAPRPRSAAEPVEEKSAEGPQTEQSPPPATTPRRLNDLFRRNRPPEETPQDDEAKPIEDAEPKPSPRWFRRPGSEPESPGNREPETTTASGEEEASGNRWFRFSPPRRLKPAEPVNDPPDEE